MPHGAALRLRRRLRRQRPQNWRCGSARPGRSTRRTPHIGHTMGDEVLPYRWWAEGALTTFPGLLVNKEGAVRYSQRELHVWLRALSRSACAADGCAFLIWDENWVQDSPLEERDRVGGEPRDTQRSTDAIQALFDLTTTGLPPTSTPASTPHSRERREGFYARRATDGLESAARGVSPVERVQLVPARTDPVKRVPQDKRFPAAQ